MAQVSSEDNSMEYEDSIKGRFGWITIKEHHILYIMRKCNGENLKFVSVRMAETHLLKSNLHYFNPKVYKCFSVKGHNITNCEAKLLTEINKNHCEYVYGQHNFISGKDYIVRLEDALEFYKFLDVCYNKVQSNIQDPEIQFGYISINSDFIPYFTKDNQQYLPLLYFVGPTFDLFLRSVELTNWDLAYLKLCFKIISIFESLYNSDSCIVVSLDDIKRYFPPDTVYTDYWPFDKINRISSIVNRTKRHNQPGAWITNLTEIISAPENTIPHTSTSTDIPLGMEVTMNAHRNGLTNHLSSSVMLQETSLTNQNLVHFHIEPIDSALRSHNIYNNQYVPSTSRQVQQQQEQQIVFFTPQQSHSSQIVRIGNINRMLCPIVENLIIDLTTEP